MDDVPLLNVAMGGFFGGIAPDGIFVEIGAELIIVRDCRGALGTEIDPGITDVDFVKQLLDKRMGDHPSGGTFVQL